MRVNKNPEGSKDEAANNKPKNAPAPSQEEIARRAYELFLARGGEHGHHEEDWQRAERDLRSARS